MRLFLSLVILVFLELGFAAKSIAQDNLQTPPTSVSAIEKKIENLEVITDLTEEQINTAKKLYNEAQSRLEDIVTLKENSAQYQADLSTAAETLKTLRAEIEAASQALNEEEEEHSESDEEPMREDDLIALEQELAQRQSDLQALRAEADAYRETLQTLSERQVSAPENLSSARAELTKITSSLTDIGDGELDAVGVARRLNLRVREFYRRLQISTLESETATLPRRLEILTARQTLNDIKFRTVQAEVTALQDKTGQRRLNEALQLQAVIREQNELFGPRHPVLAMVAKRNMDLVEQIRDVAADDATISREIAGTLSQRDNVLEDLSIAEDLAELKSLDREAGATLRRLGNQLEPLQSIRSSLSDTEKRLINATRQRLIALEELRNLPLGRVNAGEVLKQARLADAEIPPLTEADISALQVLSDTRRTLLTRVTTEGAVRVSDIRQLQTAQNKLLEATQSLQTLLNEKLLWIPSVPAIDLQWAPKIIAGAGELFSIRNLTNMWDVFLFQLTRLWPLFLLFFSVIFVLYRSRPSLWGKICSIEKDVGRVKRDRVTHTPIVVMAGLLIALPVPMVFLLLGVVFATADTVDPFIDGLGNAFLYLSMFSLIFFTWQVWDRDGSLFKTHFKMDDNFRNTVHSQLRWFWPVIGVSSGLLALTTDINSENIYEGLSLFIFIVTTLSLSWFGVMVIWLSKSDRNGQDGGFLSKHKTLVSAFVIAAPIGAAITAAAGYYETADALLWRFFTSCILMLTIYIVWATIRRVITVTQRQIKYRQALEKRDAAIKARKEKAEAEERGEEATAPPPLDTDDIDVLSMTRQSSKLLNTIIVIVFVALLWMNWSSLMPALTMFDSFQIGSYVAGQDETGKDIIKAVTVWSLIQSLVIIIITFIAAKNLPGFLEIFVLDKIGVDPGTRYAVVTILGYIIVATGVIIGFDRLGLQWSQLQFVAAGLSVGIGFGLQKIIANFVSGLIILFERPVRIGDYVTIGEQSGTVSRIKIRATTLSDLENREILIPNEALISERVTNWTLSNSVTRLSVGVGIAYGSDTESARDLMLQTVKSIPKVLDTPPPQVLFIGFGDSSLNFEIRAFLRNFDDRFPIRHQILTEVNKTLEEAGISIPFPQVDLNIVSQTVPLKVEGEAQKTTSKRKPKSKS